MIHIFTFKNVKLCQNNQTWTFFVMIALVRADEASGLLHKLTKIVHAHKNSFSSQQINHQKCQRRCDLVSEQTE